jgi:GNAT superfamily N-acetyltransferase
MGEGFAEPDGISVVMADWDDPAGAALRAAQRVELIALYEGDAEPGAKPTASDVSVFVIAYNAEGAAVGCGALRELGPSTAEVKRMYVVPDLRGRGISRLILAALEAQAVTNGLTLLKLETGTLQSAAIALYESAGYRPIEPWGAYADSPFSRCYAKAV